MRNKLAISATMLFAAAIPWQANASTFDFSFAGPGVSGAFTVTYGTATDAKYPQAFEVTGITGTFSDSNAGLNIVNAPAGLLVPVNHATPEPGNVAAPHDFSRFAVASGLSAQSNGFLTYDNLLYPGGSPQSGSDYPFFGGFLDVYGLLFNIGGGRVVDFWSNGDPSGSGHPDYGVALATSASALDYVGGGVSASPEPGAVFLLGGGLFGMLVWRRYARPVRSL